MTRAPLPKNVGQGTADTNVHEDMTNYPAVFHEKGTATLPLRPKPPLAQPAESNSTHLKGRMITYQVLIDKTPLRWHNQVSDDRGFLWRCLSSTKSPSTQKCVLLIVT